MSQVAPPQELQDLIARAIRNFAGCMLARLDGKSKVEYLAGEPLRQFIRSHARRLLLAPPPTWEAIHQNFMNTATPAFSK
jgi:hypothetical protein